MTPRIIAALHLASHGTPLMTRRTIPLSTSTGAKQGESQLEEMEPQSGFFASLMVSSLEEGHRHFTNHRRSPAILKWSSISAGWPPSISRMQSIAFGGRPVRSNNPSSMIFLSKSIIHDRCLSGNEKAFIRLSMERFFEPHRQVSDHVVLFFLHLHYQHLHLHLHLRHRYITAATTSPQLHRFYYATPPLLPPPQQSSYSKASPSLPRSLGTITLKTGPVSWKVYAKLWCLKWTLSCSNNA